MKDRRNRKSEWFNRSTISQMLTILLLIMTLCAMPAGADVTWQRKSSATADMPTPNAGNQQTCCMVLDIDKDGIDDFVVGERTQTPSVVWYKYNGSGWDKFVIDDTKKKPEAGGDSCDIDRDGDLDIILGQDASGNNIWWWENPYPDFSKPWTCRNVKKSGASKHHDQTVADFDGDGQAEFISWNQRAKKLLLYEIPLDPKSTQVWPATTIYSWSSGREREGFPSVPTDIDLDGKVDIVGGGRWFKHQGGTSYEENVVDANMAFTQCAAGQLVKGGRPEIVFSPGDMDGDAKWYQWNGSEWVAHTLRHVIHGHTCEIRDIDSDGNMDIFIGEMGNPGAGDDAKLYVWYGDGKGGFKETIASEGQGIHEGKLADLDGDGDMDILLKPYNHNSPRLDVLLNSDSGWNVLFDGSNLEKWQMSQWAIKDHTLTRGPKRRSGMIWSKERFGDFILDLEFKTEGNSGIFFRTDNTKNPVQTGIEIQVYKRVAKPTTHSCGAVYDALAPSKEMTKDGQWNHITITAHDNEIDITLNGEPIIDMDLNERTQAGWNAGPPRTKNNFKTALKDFKREGHIGFQDHGADVWYRNVRIKRL
ncbi:MAG: family 16 glycoside hydrolase [Planctomycetota bacterium]